MNSQDTYRDRVYDFLYKMPVGKAYIVDNICKAGSRDKFIEIVKEFMEATRLQYSYGLEFSDDYTIIRKDDVSRLPCIQRKEGINNV